MLSQKTLDKIVYEYQHGGVKQYHPEISLSERKALLKYLFSLPSKCAPECEATHKNSQATRPKRPPKCQWQGIGYLLER